jgi:hypothetical protein
MVGEKAPEGIARPDVQAAVTKYAHEKSSRARGEKS